MIISSSYNSDEVNCRPASVEAGIEEYVVGSDVDDHSDPDSNDSNGNESLEVELLGRPVEAAKLLNRLIHVDGLREDVTYSFFVIQKKMKSLIIQKEKQCPIKDFFKYSNESLKNSILELKYVSLFVTKAPADAFEFFIVTQSDKGFFLKPKLDKKC